MSILCDTIRRDVLADERLRATAFDLEEKVDEFVETEGEIANEIDLSEVIKTNQTEANDNAVNGREEMEEIMEAIETFTSGTKTKNETPPYQ